MSDTNQGGAEPAPPIVGAEPASLGASMFTGTREDQNLRLLNGGGSPLEFSLSVVPKTAAGGSCAPTRACSCSTSRPPA